MLGVQDESAVVPARERTTNRGLQEQLRREKSTTAQLQEELQVCRVRHAQMHMPDSVHGN